LSSLCFLPSDVETLLSRLSDIAVWSWDSLDAHVCPSIRPSHSSPSELLSSFLGRPVLLVLKGSKPRLCEPTSRAPDLGTPERPAPFEFQDGFPLLVASEESLAETAKRVEEAVGNVPGVEAGWKEKGEKKLGIERFRPNIVFEGAGVPLYRKMGDVRGRLYNWCRAALVAWCVVTNLTPSVYVPAILMFDFSASERRPSDRHPRCSRTIQGSG
jgi:hypothetical protein